MSLPITERIFRAVKCALERIHTADGYYTEAGERVYRVLPQALTDELPLLIIWPGTESSTDNGGRTIEISLSFDVELYVLADTEETGTNIELAKADVKRALLAGNLSDYGDSLGALKYNSCQPVPRKEGASAESVALNFSISFKEVRGDPASKNLIRPSL